MGFFSKIRGTFETLFQIGKAGPNIKTTGGVFEMRNNADSAYAITRGLDPVGAQDYVTKTWHETNNASANGEVTVVMPLALVTKVSTTTIPDNAVIQKAVLDVTAAYDAGALFLVDRTGDATKILSANGDSDLSVIGQYEIPQITDWAATGAGTVTATMTNVPTVGAADLYITYSTPTDIS